MSSSHDATVPPVERNPQRRSVRFRLADADDAERIALLHVDSWRRHYRGAYADSFLDGEVISDRRAVWAARLGSPSGTETVLAEQDARLVGFVHVVFDQDPQWGSLVDNLHVVNDVRRMGIGSRLLHRASQAVAQEAASNAMYLWVLQQNDAAQQFYRRCGATCEETALASPPGGDPTRLSGAPFKLRMTWRDVATAPLPSLHSPGESWR